jgi:hypothetical protein
MITKQNDMTLFNYDKLVWITMRRKRKVGGELKKIVKAPPSCLY